MLENTRLWDYLYPLIVPAIVVTLEILVLSFVICVIAGLMLGIVLYISRPEGLRPNPIICTVIDKFVDVVRSFPSLIFIVAITPLTRLVLDTTIGVPAAVFAITLASIPYAIRLTEISLTNINREAVQAAISFGATDTQIVWHVILVEALPALISNYTLMMINMLGMTAIAGAVGAGGLGAVALTYGYQQFDYSIMYFIVVILMIIVFCIETTGRRIRRLVD